MMRVLQKKTKIVSLGCQYGRRESQTAEHTGRTLKWSICENKESKNKAQFQNHGVELKRMRVLQKKTKTGQFGLPARVAAAEHTSRALKWSFADEQWVLHVFSTFPQRGLVWAWRGLDKKEEKPCWRFSKIKFWQLPLSVKPGGWLTLWPFFCQRS